MANGDKRINMSEAQWDFADEVIRDLFAYAGMLQHADIDDIFQYLMLLWALPLLVLAWETLDSIVALVRRGNRRIAYPMIRPLMEYAVRLAFYAIDAQKMIDRVNKSGRLGPAGTVYGTEAYKDWNNGSQKFLNYLGKVNLDLDALTDNERADFQKSIDKAQAGRAQEWARMLDVVEGKDTRRGKTFAAEYGFQSAFLHGDQLSTVEMFALQRPSEERTDFSSLFSEQRVISTALTSVILLMIAAGKATGREYGVRNLYPRLREMFD